MARHRPRRQGPSHRSVIAGGVVIGLLLGGGLVAAAAVPLPSGPPTLTVGVPASPASSDPTVIPFPSQGESAVAIPSLGVFITHNVQAPVPIASLTKLMTAYVTLRDLPLTPSQSGPYVVVTTADVAEYKADLKAGESCILVAAGEVLTERNLLDGLLVRSANNFATLLARLVAGDNASMVVLMNEAAASLKLTATSYVDVSGFDPKSQSDATDLLHLSEILMLDPTFAAIVRQTSVTLPVAGTVDTYTPYLGTPHVVGVKTGTTSESGGCMVMAYDAIVGGRTVQVLDVVLGQFSRFVDLLGAAGHAAYVLARGTVRYLSAWRVTRAGRPVGVIGWPSRTVPVLATSTIIVPTFPGIAAGAGVAVEPWGPNAVPSGQTVATVFVHSGSFRSVSEVVTSGSLTRPSLAQRLR